ncbi:hypothetical protein ACFFGR_23000 [Arthrobacter liuii]|uniref:Uncharacterized protein n=1 Tax=Arthrobacter liuii TaxID=1476996 RepID=A0ABQ2AYQ6_9MICC|nr:hypothetical protein [Arthrobacter liuii]GGI02099.1 hypothetical protein GCM10007170_43040 [Arthrobacter liuii]
MDEQSRPVEPRDDQGTEDTGKNLGEEQGAGAPAAEQSAKPRAAYLDPRGSESTRELRDTARRRRDAEEKLQQHLMEAKDHVPNEFHEHHGHEHAGHEHLGTGRQVSHHPEDRTEESTKGGATGAGETGGEKP